MLTDLVEEAGRRYKKRKTEPSDEEDEESEDKEPINVSEEVAPRNRVRKTQASDEEDEGEEPSTTLHDRPNSVLTSGQAQKKVPKKDDYIEISSDEEEEESSSTRPKLNKGKGKETDSDAELVHDEVEMTDDLKVGQPELGAGAGGRGCSNSERTVSSCLSTNAADPYLPLPLELKIS